MAKPKVYIGGYENQYGLGFKLGSVYVNVNPVKERKTDKHPSHQLTFNREDAEAVIAGIKTEIQRTDDYRQKSSKPEDIDLPF